MCAIPVTLGWSETDSEIDASFEGVLGHEAAGLLANLANVVRAAAVHKTVRLDITRATAIQEVGLAGLEALEQAARDAGVALEIIGSTLIR